MLISQAVHNILNRNSIYKHDVPNLYYYSPTLYKLTKIVKRAFDNNTLFDSIFVKRPIRYDSFGNVISYRHYFADHNMPFYFENEKDFRKVVFHYLFTSLTENALKVPKDVLNNIRGIPGGWGVIPTTPIKG